MSTAVPHSGATRAPGRRLPRRSTLLLAASVLAGLLLVLWGVDRLARWGAEAVLTDRIAAETGVRTPPEVEIDSSFVLLQMLRGRYEDVEVGLEGIASGPLRIERLDAELSGVRLSFHDLLYRNPVPIYVEGSQERATLRYDDLNTYLELTGRPVRIENASDGEVRLTGSVQIFGREVSASSQAGLTAEDGRILVQPTELQTGTALDAASRLLLQQRFGFAVPVDSLPFGQRLTAIDPQESTVEIEARGDGVFINA